MDRVRAYFLSVTAAAIICGIIKTLMQQKGLSSEIVKLLCAVFLTLIVMHPVASLPDYTLSAQEWLDYHHAQEISADGRNAAYNAMATIIKQRCEAYILDKAHSMDLEVTVNVTVGGDDIPIPRSVEIYGSVSPYAKTFLQDYIADSIGITKENQIWKAEE